MIVPAFVSRFFLTLFLTGAALLLLPSSVHAQGTAAQNFTQPNVDANVEQNQHTFIQATTIEVLATFVCQLAGIDPINPSQPCLGVNPVTNKIGYATPPNADGTPQVGGLLGMSTQMIGMMYIPPATSSDYGNYLASNFGIAKPAYAADGFTALRPLLQLWVGIRNISYSFLILVFVLIGIGIMLRFRIDPRTVMTIQNRIPKVVVTLLMVTGSYAMAAGMIDIMWTMTYAGINVITSSGGATDIGCNAAGNQALESNPVVDKDDNGNCSRLSKVASNELITTPLAYVGRVFQHDTPVLSDNGVYWIAWFVSQATGGIVQDAIESIIPKPSDDCNPWKLLIPVYGAITEGADCAEVVAGAVVGPVVGFFVNIITLIIVIVTLLVVLFRVWWMLLKAYISILVFIVLAPGLIVLKLIPNGPFGIEWWLRRMTANLIVFPLVVWDIVAARVFMSSFRDQTQGGFVPPLIGNQNMESFGILIAFGFILILPTVVDTVRKAMKSQSNPQISATILAGIAAGGRAPSELGRRTLARQFRHEDRHRGLEEGPMRQWLRGRRNAPETLPANATRSQRVRAGFSHVRSRVYDIVVRPSAEGGRGGGGGHSS